MNLSDQRKSRNVIEPYFVDRRGKGDKPISLQRKKDRDETIKAAVEGYGRELYGKGQPKRVSVQTAADPIGDAHNDIIQIMKQPFMKKALR